MTIRHHAVALVAGCVLVSGTACRSVPPPSPAAEPFVVRWTAQDIIDTFAIAGLPVAGAVPAGSTADTDWMDDWGATSTLVVPLAFLATPAPNMSPPTVSVYAFGDAQDMWDMVTEAHLSRNYRPSTFDRAATPFVFGWSFVVYRDNVVIDIASDVPLDLAERYERALMAMQ